jgi:hypothetical protein
VSIRAKLSTCKTHAARGSALEYTNTAFFSVQRGFFIAKYIGFVYIDLLEKLKQMLIELIIIYKLDIKESLYKMSVYTLYIIYK